MGLNFRKSVKIDKNTRMNFSKSGVGVSTGVKGARVSVGPRGVRRTVGIPGTGIYATQQISGKKVKQSRQINTKHSAEWYIFSIIVAIMVGVAIFIPPLTILFFSIIGISFIGYLIVHSIRKAAK